MTASPARVACPTVLAIALLHGWCVGCAGASNDDAFTFTSIAEDGSDLLLDRPVAVGASLDIQVRLKGTTSSGGRVEIARVSFEPAGIFAIDTLANPVVVRAMQPGQATLRVVDHVDQQGSILLSAVEAARIEPIGSMLIGSIETALASEVMAQGVLLHASVSLFLDVELRDASDSLLLGYGAAHWSTSQPDTLAIESALSSTSSRVRCVLGYQTGSVLVSSGLGPEVEIEVTDEIPSARTLRLFGARTFLTDPAPAEVTPPIMLPTGRTRTLAVLGFDDHERVIAASFANGLAASAPTGFQETLVFLPNHHLLSISGISPGQVDIDLTWLGASRPVRVIVGD
ncbi:MAG: hypothetical protein IPK13_11295 [Deltaproteobacteria bacterium]|nr:hypothetical protein [Deltaproteobacteria bacterium]